MTRRVPGYPAPQLDIEALRGKFDCVHSAEHCYRFFRALGMEYGPAHRGLVEVGTGMDARFERFALGSLRMPSGVVATRDLYRLHPSIMDSALQAGVAMLRDLKSGERSGAVPLPCYAARVTVWSATPVSAWAYVRAARGNLANGKTLVSDVDVCDDAGRVCVRMEGICSRVSKDGLLPS